MHLASLLVPGVKKVELIYANKTEVILVFNFFHFALRPGCVRVRPFVFVITDIDHIMRAHRKRRKIN